MGRISAAASAAALLWLAIALARGDFLSPPGLLAALSLLCLLLSRDGDALERWTPLAVFLAALAFYLSSFRWHGGDDTPNSLIPFCLFRHGTFALDPVINPWFLGMHDFVLLYRGRHLSVFPVAPAILALPVYVIPLLAGVSPSEAFLHQLSKLSGALITAASAAVMLRALQGRCSRAWALSLTGLYALGSWAMSVSSQALWAHGPASLGVMLGVWGLLREGRAWDFLTGFGMALAVTARPDSVFFLAAAAALILFHDRRRIFGFILGAAVPLALLAAYWLHYTGRLRPPESRYQAALFTGFQPGAFVALLISPSRGLAFFFPAAAFGIWSGLRRRGEPLVFWMLLACAAPLFLMSFYRNWVGGGTFGPRYFAVSVMILTFFCAEAEGKIRASPGLLTLWCACAAFCLFVHAVGAYMNWPETWGIEAVIWDWRMHPLIYLFGPRGGLHALGPSARAALAAISVGAFTALVVGLRRALSLNKGS